MLQAALSLFTALTVAELAIFLGQSVGHRPHTSSREHRDSHTDSLGAGPHADLWLGASSRPQATPSPLLSTAGGGHGHGPI